MAPRAAGRGRRRADVAPAPRLLSKDSLRAQECHVRVLPPSSAHSPRRFVSRGLRLSHISRLHISLRLSNKLSPSLPSCIYLSTCRATSGFLVRAASFVACLRVVYLSHYRPSPSSPLPSGPTAFFAFSILFAPLPHHPHTYIQSISPLPLHVLSPRIFTYTVTFILFLPHSFYPRPPLIPRLTAFSPAQTQAWLNPRSASPSSPRLPPSAPALRRRRPLPAAPLPQPTLSARRRRTPSTQHSSNNTPPTPTRVTRRRTSTR